MPIKFSPHYKITSKIAKALMRIEAAKEKVLHLPMTPTVLANLRETARLYSTHYSTLIEGNRLTNEQVEEVIKHASHFPGRERDEDEVKGYYAALHKVEQWAAKGVNVTELMIQTIHALVMGGGRIRVKPSSYRTGQNVIRDGRTKTIVYLPPEAKDVRKLMKELVSWIQQNKDTLCPITSAIAHYQFATIHPYYDGNGRTARLLTTLILHLGQYDLKGLYSLEEYYAQNLGNYYEAISVGPSHNYYFGRAEADITHWIEYFVGGMAVSFEKVIEQMAQAKNLGEQDHEALLRKFNPKQRKVLELFQVYETVTSRQIGELFGFKARTASALCKKWAEEGFLNAVDPSKKGRKYQLNTLLSRKLLGGNNQK